MYATPFFSSSSRHFARSIPSSERSILLDVAIPLTRISKSKSFFNLSDSSEIWSKRVPPILPGPNSPIESVCCDIKNTEWRALKAFVASLDAITADMFLSDEPCAIALMFIPARANEEKNFPATPIRPGIASPTAANIESSVSLSMLVMLWLSSSFANSCLNVLDALFA